LDQLIHLEALEIYKENLEVIFFSKNEILEAFLSILENYTDKQTLPFKLLMIYNWIKQ